MVRRVEVPRNADDRSTVANWEQVRDVTDHHSGDLEFFAVTIPLFAYAHSMPTITTHTADANTLALWQGDPPNNGGSGLIDSSGHGKTLVMGAGTERYGPLGMGQLGFMCDGSNYWQRAGAVNDASLNLVGDMTVEYLVRVLTQPPGRVTSVVTNGGAAVTYAAIGETGGNDNVLWASWIENANAFGPNTAGVFGTSWFWETGPGTNSAVEDQALVSMYDPHHIAIVRSAGGGTITTYIDGFRQSITTGQPVGTVGGAPIQFVRIGADHNAAQFLSGVVGSVKISNVARSANYIFNDAAHCLGIGGREILHLRPVMYVTEPCELVEATIIPDDQTGTFAAVDAVVNLYKTDSSGSTATTAVLAKLDGLAASATAWSAYRSKKMQVPTVRPRLNEGDGIAIQGGIKTLNGSLTMKFRRLDAAA